MYLNLCSALEVDLSFGIHSLPSLSKFPLSLSNTYVLDQLSEYIDLVSYNYSVEGLNEVFLIGFCEYSLPWNEIVKGASS